MPRSPAPAAAAAAALAALVIGSWAQAQPSNAGEGRITLQLHVQDSMNAGSRGPFEVLLSSSGAAGGSPGVWRPLELGGAGLQQGAWFAQRLEAPASPPTSLGLRALGADGLGLDRVVLGGVELTEGLPLWLDNPCDPSASCATEHTWAVPLPTTTSVTTTSVTTTSATTTSVTATATRTSTATTTATRTSSATATATGTSTATTQTLTRTRTTSDTMTSSTTTSTASSEAPPVALSAAAQLTAVATPPAFYDEVESVLSIQVNRTEMGDVRLSDFQGKVSEVVKNFVSLEPPSTVRCRLEWQSPTEVRATLSFRVVPSSAVSALDIRDALLDGARRSSLNDMLANLGSSTGVEAASAHLTHCRIGALFCCVDAVVYGIVHNAGVIVAYKHSFALAMALVATVSVVFLRVWWLSLYSKDAECREARRAQVLMPLVAVGAAFQALVSISGSLHKYNLLLWRCNENDAAAEGCPPALWVTVSEVTLFGCLAVVFVASVLFWWRQQLLADCDIGDPPEDWAWRPVMPLESLIRRSHMLGFLEVRPSDRADGVIHGLLVVNDVVISFAVVLTSFFLLQQLLVAWHPYKLIYELTVGFLLRELFRKVALTSCMARCRRTFVCLGICVFSVLDIWMWAIVFWTLADVAPNASITSVLRILDIAMGAGILNYFLGQMCVAFLLRWFSVYLYEPSLRYLVRRRVYVTDGEQMDRVKAIVSAPGSCWEISGTPTLLGGRPRRFRGRMRAGSLSSAAASCSTRPHRASSLAWSPALFGGAGLTAGELSEAGGSSCGCSDDISSSSSSSSCSSSESEDSEVDMTPSVHRPLLVQLKRTDWRCTVRLVAVLDVLFSVHKELPVDPRDKRAAMLACCSEGGVRTPGPDDLEDMMVIPQLSLSSRRTTSSSMAEDASNGEPDDSDSEDDDIDDDGAGSSTPLTTLLYAAFACGMRRNY